MGRYTQFTCFTGTKSHILTPEALQESEFARERETPHTHTHTHTHSPHQVFGVVLHHKSGVTEIQVP